ncbi:ABC transporter substrate-binding protein [Roseococcus sp. SYP-B2431]|uniref:ABC transporter substrate-binding protein n=1 Tax=Roseococcus sp. SYP-B2431 TaxID=2496640 RepID=UPI00103AB589|nr:ABC transporter substrate-binding protein [Roseococcus sp. SYP-B2431]TCH96729.1 ABC transporter substrate-binding protein [Roseococcus sp. SYP-B2431]
MQRRHLLTTSAAAIAAPRLGHAQRARPLRFVPFADLAVLDPLATTSLVTRGHAYMAYDTLYGLDAQLRPQPQMVEGAATENDGRLWRLTLREGLRFHDGEPVRARDCVASLARWGRIDAYGQALYAVVDEVSAPEDRVIQFRLKRPFPRLPDALAKVIGFVPVMMPERLLQGPPGQPIREVVGSGPLRYLPGESLSGSHYSYEKFAGYVPRPSGGPSFTAGPKRVSLERVELRIIPDASTAANALATGEIDWYDQIQPDLIAPLRRNRNLIVEPCESSGYVGFLQFNHRLPPFDNPAIRRAVLGAVDQTDFCIAVMGQDPTLWRTGLGFFCPGTPLASEAGLAALGSPRDLERAKRDLQAAGYAGEKVTLINASDIGFVSAMNMVAADLLRRLGMNVDALEMDAATMFQRRMRQDGWNVYAIGAVGLQTLDPAVNGFLRGNRGPFGWADLPRVEALRAAWLDAPDLPAQQEQARRLQLQALQDLPYVPIGQYLVQTAYRNNIRRGVKEMSVFWDLERR